MQESPAAVDPTPSRLNRIGQAYLMVKTIGKRAPSSINDLNTMLKDAKLGDADLKSERDGQPFVIVWGANEPLANDIMKAPIIAYEAKGKDGKRWVVRLLDDSLGLLTDADFAKATFAAGHIPNK